MSHIVEIRIEVRDAVAIGSACQRLKLEAPTQGTAKLFSSSATGVIVKLPGWRYPAVFDMQSGQARYDNYGGRWGEQGQLDRFLQGWINKSSESVGGTNQRTRVESTKLQIVIFQDPLSFRVGSEQHLKASVKAKAIDGLSPNSTTEIVVGLKQLPVE